MTIEEFGQTIKNKYPEYRNKSDEEVGNAMLKKYPIYQKQITAPSAVKERGATETPLDVGVGIMKGVASSALGLASLPQWGGKYLAEKVTGKPAPAPFQKTIRQKVEETGALEARGKAEKFGKGAEQLGEFFVLPTGKVKALKKLPAVKDIFVRGAKEGAKFGGVTAVHEGEIGKEAVISAAIGGVGLTIGPAVGFAINKAKSLIKGPVQEKIWTNLMARSRNEILANPIAKDVAKIGIAKTSKQKILNEMTKMYNTADEAITKAIKKKEKSVNVKDIDISKIEDKLWGRVGTVRTPTKLVESEIKEMGTLLSNIKIVANTYTRGKEKISLNNAYKLQLSIAREIEKSIIKTDPEKAKISRALVNELNESISKMLPKAIRGDVQKIPVLQQATVAMEKSIATGKAAQVNLTEDAALVVAGLMSGTGLTPVIGRHLAFSTAAKSGFSKLMNTYTTLPYQEKIPYYLAVKGILAGIVEDYIKED